MPHGLRLQMGLLAGLLAAIAAGQEGVPPPTPCPADASQAAPDARDSLVASDLSAASHDEPRAADLLAQAAEHGAGQLWPMDWLVLARRDESRGDFAGAAARYTRYQASLEGSGEDTRWVEPRVKLLTFAIRAAPGEGAAPQARLALADGRAALARGDRKAARERYGDALRLDSRYAEAAIAAGAMDAQQGRTADAIREYRLALAADPERVEAAVPLSNLLWDHPDRASKAESLLLLDRAAAARGDLPILQKRSAERWAQWGDPKAALERLDDWRAGASAAERKQTDSLRAELAAKVPAADPARPSESRPRPDRSRARAAAVETRSSGAGAWVWGAGVVVLVAVGAAVLARRRRLAEPGEPAAPAATTTVVTVEELSRILQSAASERQLTAPTLWTKGFPDEGQPPWIVRLPPPDWESIWRNVFASTLAAMRSAHVGGPKLVIFGSLVRDSNVPGLALRLALADNAPGTLTTEMIRGRTAGPEWVAVDEAIRAHKGSIAVAPSIDRQFTKRVLIELPAQPPG